MTMRKIFFLISCLTGFLFLIPSCYYDNEVDLYPFNMQPCDSTNVTYSQTIAPIMSANCNNCHNATTSNGNPPVITADYPGLKVVALNGKLNNSVNWVDGKHNMPQGGSKLSNCDLVKINIWIKAGSPDN